MDRDPKNNDLPSGAIAFDGSAESLARAIELVLSVPNRHDFGCRPSNGHCTAECVQRKNFRDIAEVALLEYRRKLDRQGDVAPDANMPRHLLWRQ